jgi:integrase
LRDPVLIKRDCSCISSALLLDRGAPVHIVTERIGDDPAVLLRNYAKKNLADNSVSAVISALAAGFLKA